MGRTKNPKPAARPSDLAALRARFWDRAPQCEGVLAALEAYIEEFWNRVAADASIELEDFLLDLAERIRSGDADVRERLLAARLVTREVERLVSAKQAARRVRAIAEFVTLRTTALRTIIENGKAKAIRQNQKAAVADAAEHFRCSRRTVFNALKAAREAVPAEMAAPLAPAAERLRLLAERLLAAQRVQRRR